VFFAAGKVVDGEGECLWCDATEVGLDAGGEADGGFSGAGGDDLFHEGIGAKGFGNCFRLAGGNDEVEVADDFFAAAIAAAWFDQ